MVDKKYYCTNCKDEAFIRYSDWKDVDDNIIVGKDENICTKCLNQRKKGLAMF